MNTQLPLFPKLRVRLDSVEEAAYMNRQRPLFSFLPFEYFSDRSILNPVVVSFRTADHE